MCAWGGGWGFEEISVEEGLGKRVVKRGWGGGW